MRKAKYFFVFICLFFSFKEIFISLTRHEDCNKILLVLKNEYSNLIDYNKWKYLDFVINSIEFNDVQNVNDAIAFINDKVFCCLQKL